MSGPTVRHHVASLCIDGEASGRRGMLHVRGDIDLANEGALRDAATELVDLGVQHLLVDCSDVGYIDSSGLRALIEIREHVGKAGGSLRLVSAGDLLIRLLSITGLDGLLDADGSKAAD